MIFMVNMKITLMIFMVNMKINFYKQSIYFIMMIYISYMSNNTSKVIDRVFLMYDNNINNNQEGGRDYNNKNFIDLKINGRLFPTWVLQNFKKYKLPEIMQDGSDPCNIKSNTKQSTRELRKYQAFLSKYLDFNSFYKNILIYHGLGSGKTRSAINIYNMLYNYTPGWNVYILLKATLRDSTWVKELEKWLQNDEKKFRMSNIIFISYDAPNADKAFLTAVQNADASKKSMYIIEESHNFIRNVYSNISSRQGRRAQTIYDHIIQDKKENDSVRVICLSATPAINTPFELALMFNLLRPNSFSASESEFNQMYISDSSYVRLNDARKNNFQRRIMGLVSFYIGATPDYFPSKTINYVDIIMSEYQEDIYTYFEEIEKKIALKSRGKGGSETYKSYTRQSCNFTFPLMDQGISGETRPRPNQFKLSMKDTQSIDKGRDKSSSKDKESSTYYNIQNYIQATEKFITKFDEYLIDKEEKDTKEKHTIIDDLKALANIDFNKYTQSSKKKSHLFTALYNCSAKMLAICVNILKSPGPVLVYSNYVLMEGLQIFKIYLHHLGFSPYEDNYKGDDGFRYIEYHGGIDKKERRENIEIYNHPDNVTGKLCKIIMISPAGSEGISLMNTRQVHLMEPYWHEVRMEQMIGRAIRLCSHKALPMKDRHVEVYRYKSVRAGTNTKWTTDQYIEDLARSKDGLIRSFLDAIKEVAVDCQLNKAHNKLAQDYRCFQFDEPSLFESQIGPAFKEDLYDDLKLDNGSNSVRSETKRIKVIKIKAVEQLSDSDDGSSSTTNNAKYSKAIDYWYSLDTHVVYDYELYFAFGKVGLDDDGLPLKLDNETYIITHTIPIPRVVKN
jgi:superfamily II DNA or RNA helicase